MTKATNTYTRRPKYDVYKYSGTGNTFVLIDGRDRSIGDYVTIGKELCQKHNVDGLLVLESSQVAALKMRIINRDGTEAEMCGNGSRCAAHWAHHFAGLPRQFMMETGAGILSASLNGEEVKIRLTNPTDFKPIKDLVMPEAVGDIYFINTGVPHLVVEVKHIETVDIEKRGAWIRYHELFKPKGTNASFFEYIAPGEIKARVYERGVEGETQSCGTGSTACALVSAYKYQLMSPIQVSVTSGDVLQIYFQFNNSIFTEVYLEGKVDFKGKCS